MFDLSFIDDFCFLFSYISSKIAMLLLFTFYFLMQYPEGHVSRSIYAIFRIVSTPPSKDGLLEEFFPDLCLAIWTTTPWTIPANAGKSSSLSPHICFKPPILLS